MSNPIKSPAFGRPLRSAPSLAVPYRAQHQETDSRQLPVLQTMQESKLAAFATTTNAGKTGYGALLFWIVVAVLVAARIAFLDPGKIEPTSSPLGTNATPAWSTGGIPSLKD